MTTLAPQQQLLEPAMDDLDIFLELVRSSNPFMDNRVNGLSADTVTVADIHRAAFERLTALAHDACQRRRGLGAVLWGEAGIGKSHLLSRLTEWAEGDRPGIALYLHNLQASPENLPRSLLKVMISILTHGQVSSFNTTPLFELAFALVKESLHNDQSKHHPWKSVVQAWSCIVDRLSTEDFARAAPVDRTVFSVLLRFFRSAYRAPKTGDERIAALAVRWLAGDCLDPEQAKELGLSQGPNVDVPVALADNQQIKQVIVALSRLALSANKPLVLCFDQVDNLDDAQAAALSRFLEAVMDSSPNLLVVTAGIQATLLRWHEIKVIQDSAWDRLAHFQINPQRLTPEQGQHIIAARLEKVLTPFVELEPVRQWLQQDHFFPLGRPWVEEFFGERIDLRPRDVINGAREAWLRQQEALEQLGGPTWLKKWGNGSTYIENNNRRKELTEEQVRADIDATVTETLAGLYEQQRRNLKTLAPDAMKMADVVTNLVGHYGDFEIEQPPAGQPDRQFPFHLVCRRRASNNGPTARTGLLFLLNTSATSTAAVLRSLTELSPAPERMLLVTVEGFPLAFGAQANAKGRGYFETLRHREPECFKHLEVTLDEYAHVLALQEVIAIPRSGDLEIQLPGEKRQLNEQDVIASHHRQGRFMVSAMLRHLLT